jgi:urease accessory protein
MRIYHALLGHRDDPPVQAALARLRSGGVDRLCLAAADLARRRLRARTEAGHEVAIALPREQRLHDGALLALEDDYALLVTVAREQWLCLTAADAATALALGYHAGNLHWRVRFSGHTLLIALDGPEQAYLDRLTAFVESGRVALERLSGEPSGAFAEPEAQPHQPKGLHHGHDSHDHGHHHHHDHRHDHRHDHHQPAPSGSGAPGGQG